MENILYQKNRKILFNSILLKMLSENNTEIIFINSAEINYKVRKILRKPLQL
jgi:hypothetical protein